MQTTCDSIFEKYTSRLNSEDIFDSIVNEYMTDEGHWGNVAAGILPVCRKTGRYLISYRSAYVLEPNTWGVWGGKLDDVDNSDIKSAAKREFLEETGYDGDIEVIPSYVYRSKNFEYHNFIGIVSEEFEPTLDWETEGFRWMTYDELLELEPKHFGLVALLENSGDQVREASGAQEKL